jgi:hypothetical protein
MICDRPVSAQSEECLNECLQLNLLYFTDQNHHRQLWSIGAKELIFIPAAWRERAL